MPDVQTTGVLVSRVEEHHRSMREANEMAQAERAMLIHAMKRARAAGVTYQRMADAMGLSRQRVFDMLKDDLRRQRIVDAEDIAF